eukprot:3919656-Pyramimonas_sp.AAC.1
MISTWRSLLTISESTRPPCHDIYSQTLLQLADAADNVAAQGTLVETVACTTYLGYLARFGPCAYRSQYSETLMTST